MRVYNPQSDGRLSPGLLRTLEDLRARRGFDAKAYILAKAVLLNDYMRKHKLGGCVIGISGGVDSALVFALAVTASRMAGSPIKRILPLLIPIFSRGASNQDLATARGVELLEKFGYPRHEVDLSNAFHVMQEAIDTGAQIKGKDWAAGQLVSYLRTPALYYASSLLSQEGVPALVIGTTNRDEGAYLGFFGKASDAAVDLQLISDIHKSEVYAAAEALGVPQIILDAAPTGDMYDRRLDVEVFGAPYDFVELFLNLKCLDPKRAESIAADWDAEDKEQFDRYSASLENLHGYNAHKYIVGSPAVHLNIYPAAVPGGWQHGPHPRPWAENVPKDNFIAPFDMPTALLDRLEKKNKTRVRSTQYDLPSGDKVLVADGLLAPDEASALLEEAKKQHWLPANVYGMRRDFDPAKDKTGSWRASSYSTRLARLLWQRLGGALPMLEYFPEGSSLDAKDCTLWRAVGISPLFRFIKYAADGILVAHYDSPFDFGGGRRTLKSFITYFTGGATRFLRDPQQDVPALQRKYEDWDRPGRTEEVLLSLSPEAGSAIAFNHRLLHDSAPIDKGASEKIVMRTDIVYEKILAP